MTKNLETEAAEKLLASVQAELSKRKSAPPPKAIIARFLEVWERLAKFEANQRAIRGYGAFEEKDLPIPAAITVIQWLKNLAGQEQEDEQ